ncbi:TIGR04211 family SH3 domain-containing protein [Exilibacterium tricleocarpae]|uniref:TIGR04211 family SH3 domain-containing protein n=1 Tax=Exilibacterium tricleocarpae TaxID=2591008 RepID=UPI0015D378DA|nr:TIGR04211 family SH3 domain-containing protein [Exilibacterium tricleocarpae]
MRPFLTALFAALLINAAHAEVRYISDVLYVPLRSGQGTQFRIINKGLRSGTKLTVLEEDPGGEWTRVETERGIQGWIRNQYLLAEPTATLKLRAAQQTASQLQNRTQTLEQQLAQLQQQNQQLAARLDDSEKQGQTLNNELAEIKTISAGAIDLNSRHQTLMEEHQLLQTEIDVLKAENERLGDKSLQTWFIYGAGAVGLGVVIALVVPAVRPRRRYSDWR